MTCTRWGLVLLLYAAGILAAMQFAKLSLTLEAAAAIWPDRPVAFLVSAVSVMGLLLGAVAGAVVARFGARPAILGALALSGALSLAQAALPPYAAMLALRALEGAGHLALVVAVPTAMAAAAAPATRPVVMALWGTFFGVGFVVADLAFDALADGGPRAPYLLHGAACLALITPLAVALPPIAVRARRIDGVRAAHAAIYARARIAAPGVAHGCYTALFIALVALLPGALGAPWLTPLLPLANLGGTFAAGFLARRVPVRRMVVGANLAASAGFVTMALGGGPLVALLTLAATGVLAGANFAAVPILNPASEDQARANGGMAQLGNVGTFVGTPLLAAALTIGGAGAMLLAAAGLCVLGASASALLYGRVAAAGRLPTAA